MVATSVIHSSFLKMATKSDKISQISETALPMNVTPSDVVSFGDMVFILVALGRDTFKKIDGDDRRNPYYVGNTIMTSCRC
jgi:hypothetical protein